MLLRAFAVAMLWAAQAVTAAESPVAVTQLRTESCDAPLGIDTLAPRFSWRLEATTEGPRATVQLGSGNWVLTQPVASSSVAEGN